MNLLLDFLFLVGPDRIRRSAGELVLALAVFLALAVAVTWPAAIHLDTVILGGGELGGWLWRQWWHFQEVEALGQSDLSFFDKISLLVSLGRYPETGNILDILLLSYPLEQWFGMPVGHNLKVLGILVGNGLCAYVLARTFTTSRVVSLAAAAVAIVNPLVFQDINKTGLRQVVLWWLMLYPVVLARAERTFRRVDGVFVGIVFSLVAGFYWFYGLFAVLFSVLHVGAWVIKERPLLRQALEWMVPAFVAAVIGVLFFVMPYLSGGAAEGGQGGVERLPELTFFLEFPAYDTLASAPLRPSNYRENVLSSLHRTIDSAWPADYVFNPRHGVLALPLAAFLAGILPAAFVRKARTWFVIWWVFFLGTLGPWLKWGAQKDTADVLMLGDFVVRLPFALMFQFIPGLSRMFAPYRMASLVVVATVALVAVCLGELRPWRRRIAGLLVLVATVVQPFYRFDVWGDINLGEGGPSMWRVPTQVSSMQIPLWYLRLSSSERQGIIELPLEQQQDILTAYQALHTQKVYRSWATEPAIPPIFRDNGGGTQGKRLRWLASPEPAGDKAEAPLRDLSREPLEQTVLDLKDEALLKLMDRADYRWLIVHERGFYLQEPTTGGVAYRHAVRLVSERLELRPQEIVEHKAHPWPGKEASFAEGPAWIPWSSREVHLPVERMPDSYFMSVFDLNVWRDAVQATPAGADGTDSEAPSASEADPVDTTLPSGPGEPDTPVPQSPPVTPPSDLGPDSPAEP